MKKLFVIDEILASSITYWHMFAFVVTMPFDRFYSELVLISLLLHELIHVNKARLQKMKKPALVIGLLYLLTLAGTLYSNDNIQASKDLEKQLSLVLFPLVFSLTSLDIKKYGLPLMKIFAFTCVATIMYLYFNAFQVIRFYHMPLESLITKSFLNQNFSLPIGMHATFLSMYVLLSWAVLMQLLNDATDTRERLLYGCGLIVLLAGLIQLSSKSAFIAALIIINIVFPFLKVHAKRRWKYLVICCVVSSMIIGCFNIVHVLHERYIDGMEVDLATQVSITSVMPESRLVRWQSAWQLIRESPIVGHGTGMEITLLKSRYFADRLFVSYLNELNAHNQYISFMVKFGVIGLLLYCFILYTALRNAIAAKNFIFTSFVVIIAIVSFSENILDVNKGIFFFSFFYCLLANVSRLTAAD